MRGIWENPSWQCEAEVILGEASGELMGMAVQLQRQNRVAEAIAAYREILARWPKLADAWYNLAVLQRQTFRFDEALASYQHSLASGVARPEEVHLNRSVIFSDFLRDHASAAAELQQALTLNPAYTPAMLNLANLYEDFGKRAEASSLYARILTLEPQSFEALARFANIQPADNVDVALVKALRDALTAASAMSDRASLGFALGRLLDAAGDYRAAFLAYTAANRASLASAGPHVVPYDGARQQAFIDRLIGTGLSGARANATAIPPRPIFIVGMFRSGSTVTEQLLAAIPGVAAGGEIDFLPRLINTELTPLFEVSATLTPEQLDEMAARYRAELMRVSAYATYVIDKRPDNFLYIGLIKRLFPDAKIVHTTRDPLDNCLSIFFLHLEQQMSYALNIADIAHYYREYRRLMAYWKSEFAGDILDFSYDALVEEPQRQLKALCVFLGLPCPGQVPTVAARSGAIRTASVWQVREPLYRTSSGRARHYAAELKELRDELSNLP
ncbi:MAG: sulfotransferase [Pseudomonadota bacterium]|nr:sulfotransferase [Pseudomonadota bacterium]